MPRRLTTDEWVMKARNVHGDQYDYSQVDYRGSENKVILICYDHGPWAVTPKSHLAGRGCRKCGYVKSRQKQLDNTPIFIKKARKVHTKQYDYSLVKYVDSKTPVIVGCPTHGKFSISPNVHLNGGKCPDCPRKQSVTTDVFTSNADRVHDGLYDYSLVDYVDNRTKVTLICPKHGKFEQAPRYHLRGQGCPKCGRKSSVNTRTSNTSDWILKAKEVHGDRYDYSKVDYVNASTKICIIIKDTGEEFWQQPNNHLSGRKSLIERHRNAAKQYTMSTEQFVNLAKKRHPIGFDYSVSEYHGSRSPIDIICDTHGRFTTIPMYHLQNDGCPRCTTRVSKPEQEVFEFVSQYVDDATQSDRTIIKPKELDIVVPSKKIAIEYCGLYWHSTKAGRPPNYHRDKHNSVDKTDYRLVTIFEDEWLEKQTIVKDTLRHFMGVAPKGVGARNTEIKEIEWKSAKEFLNHHHLMGAGQPGNYRIGAYYGDELISVMVFGYPSDERGKKDVIEMKRFATNSYNNTGVGSKMFKHAIRNKGYSRVIAFVDRRWFNGSFKFVAGFSAVHVTSPAKFWTKGNKRFHRRFKTKAGMLKSGEITDRSLTKEQMLAKLGYYPIYDCGKVKLEWVSPIDL